MFKFLKDIKELKATVKEILEEFNEDYVQTGFFSRRRTASKELSDLYAVTDKILGHLGLEANEVPEVPAVPSHWEVVKKGTKVAKVAKAKKSKKTK